MTKLPVSLSCGPQDRFRVLRVNVPAFRVPAFRHFGYEISEIPDALQHEPNHTKLIYWHSLVPCRAVLCDMHGTSVTPCSWTHNGVPTTRRRGLWPQKCAKYAGRELELEQFGCCIRVRRRPRAARGNIAQNSFAVCIHIANVAPGEWVHDRHPFVRTPEVLERAALRMSAGPR